MDVGKLPIKIADPAGKAEAYIKAYYDEYNRRIFGTTNDYSDYRPLDVYCPNEIDLHHLDAIGGMGKLLLFIEANPGMSHWGVKRGCTMGDKLAWDSEVSKNANSIYWYRKVDEGVFRPGGHIFYSDLIERAKIGQMVVEESFRIPSDSLVYEKGLFITELGEDVLIQNELLKERGPALWRKRF